LGRRLLLRLLRFEKEAAGIDDLNRVITIDSTLGLVSFQNKRRRDTLSNTRYY
jgi:hypothetical protein